MSKSRSATPVHSFLERLVKLANYEVTPYGSINPWKERPQDDSPQSSKAIVTLEGQIRPGVETPYAINGMDILIDSNTMIVGDLALGVSVRVKVGRGGSAKTVVVTEA